MQLFRTVPCIPVKSEFAGRVVDTTVDSALARYYLETFLQGRKCNREFDLIIERVHSENKDLPPSREYVKDLSSRFSPDFATIFLAKRLLDDTTNFALYSMFQIELERALAGSAAGDYRLHPGAQLYLMLCVPGWVYKSEPASGADLAGPRRVLTQHGLENHLIEIAQTGSARENADYIAQEIRRFSQLNKKIVLVSASSGGASAALALGSVLKPDELTNVKAWLNIGGLLQGSFHADAAIRFPMRWFVKTVTLIRGWDYASIEDMTTSRSRERFREVHLPPEVVCLNYVGIPLSGNVTKRGMNGYLNSRREGPNDGMTLITDALMPRSPTIPVLGVDHYLDPQMDIKSLALAETVMKYLETQTQKASAEFTTP